MAQTAVIFTTNRVIRRLTTDVSPAIAADETAIALAVDIDLSGGSPGWKLDVSNNKVACTLAEWQAAGMDPSFNATQAAQRLTDYKQSATDGINWGMPIGCGIGSLVTLTNIGTTFDAITASKGLGFAVIDFTGATSLTFGVFVSKIGTGTQTWQLWNVTDGVEVTHIDDAGAVGDKLLTTTINTGLPSAGVKILRVRAKSTVAADDPVYYGAGLLVKFGVLTAFFNKLLAFLG